MAFHIQNKDVGNKQTSEDWRSRFWLDVKRTEKYL
jgi:hypothetical protein